MSRLCGFPMHNGESPVCLREPHLDRYHWATDDTVQWTYVACWSPVAGDRLCIKPTGHPEPCDQDQPRTVTVMGVSPPELSPGEELALNVAWAQTLRGEYVTPNVALVCVATLHRLTIGDPAADWTVGGSAPQTVGDPDLPGHLHGQPSDNLIWDAWREDLAERLWVSRHTIPERSFTPGGPDSWYNAMVTAALMACPGEHTGTHGEAAAAMWRTLAGGDAVMDGPGAPGGG